MKNKLILFFSLSTFFSYAALYSMSAEQRYFLWTEKIKFRNENRFPSAEILRRAQQILDQKVNSGL